ncbi:hypothetical protein GCM10017782_27250 [Deinococcus ficus]|nr:hypothetical protein GCM10017782_27250 [Deinococcus ficus]
MLRGMSDVSQRAAGVLRAVGLTESPVSALEREDALFVLTPDTLLYQDAGGTRRVTLRDLTRIHSDAEGTLRVETPAGTALSASLVGFDPARLQGFFNEVRDVTRRAKEAAAPGASPAQAAPQRAAPPAAAPLTQERTVPRPAPVAPQPTTSAPARPEPIVLGDDPAPTEAGSTPPPRPLHQPRYVPGPAAAVTPVTPRPEAEETDDLADLAPTPTRPAPTPAAPPASAQAPLREVTVVRTEPVVSRPATPGETARSLLSPAAAPSPAVVPPQPDLAPVVGNDLPAPAPAPAVRATVACLGGQAELVAGWAGRLRVLGGVMFVATLALAVVQFTQGAPLAGLWTAIAGGIAGIALLAVADLARLLAGLARALTGETGE